MESTFKDLTTLADNTAQTFADNTAGTADGYLWYRIKAKGDSSYGPYTEPAKALSVCATCKTSPADFAQAAFSQDYLKMSWKTVATATSYYLAYANKPIGSTYAEREAAKDGLFTEAPTCSGVTELSCRYEGAALKTDIAVSAVANFNGSRYWKARAQFGANGGAFGGAVLMWRANAPAVPTAVVRKLVGDKKYNATDKNVTITWTAPALLNGIMGDVKDSVNFGVTNYKVFYGESEGKATTAVAVAYTGTRHATTKVLVPEYSHDVTSLTRGKFYYAVQACTIAGCSASSANMTAGSGVVSASAPSKPGCVAADAANKTTANNIYIKWTAPTETNGSAITGYKLYYSINDSSAANLLASASVSSPYNFDVTNAKYPDGQYYF